MIELPVADMEEAFENILQGQVSCSGEHIEYRHCRQWLGSCKELQADRAIRHIILVKIKESNSVRY